MFDKKEMEIYQYSNPSKIGASFSWQTILDEWMNGSSGGSGDKSELTQQDGRGKKTANLVWQAWQ